MCDVDFVAEHLNVFNTIVTQLISIRVKVDEEDHYMGLLGSLLVSWDDLVMAIRSTVKKLLLDEVMATSLPKEVR